MEAKTTPKRILKLFAISAKMDLAWLFRDTRYALVMILSDIVQNVGASAGMFLIASRFGGVGGMSADEVLFMTAYLSLNTGLFLMFGARNNIEVSRLIGRGQMEHMFLQPLSLKVQLFTCSFQPFTNSGSFITGIILMVIAVGRLDMPITPMWIFMLLVYQIVSMVVIVARCYILSSLVFYSPTAENIAHTAVVDTWTLSTFPLGGMPKFLVFPLLTIMPEGLLAWFPSMCLLGKPPLNLTAYYPMIFALILSFVAIYFFRKGMRYYVKEGSNRYVPWGFRR